MTWSIHAAGDRPGCIAQVEASTNNGIDNAQHKLAKEMILLELRAYHEDASIKVEAYGYHASDDSSGSVRMLITRTGTMSRAKIDDANIKHHKDRIDHGVTGSALDDDGNLHPDPSVLVHPDKV